MQSLPWIIYFNTLAVTASSIKVNYYSDGGCNDYMISISPSDNGKCYTYNWRGQNSVGIAECHASLGCYCDFYTEENCKGNKVYKEYQDRGGWCASNWGHGFLSMKCNALNSPF